MNSLLDYITINTYTRYNHVNKEITVVQYDSKTLENLQAADVISGTVYHAYTYACPHFLNMIEPRAIKKDEFPRNNFKGSLLQN